MYSFFFFFSSRRRHTRSLRDWSSDVCSSDLLAQPDQHQHLVLAVRVDVDHALAPQGLVERFELEIGPRRVGTLVVLVLLECQAVVAPALESVANGLLDPGAGLRIAPGAL